LKTVQVIIYQNIIQKSLKYSPDGRIFLPVSIRIRDSATQRLRASIVNDHEDFK
jgi:signal transduction histidine kinase